MPTFYEDSNMFQLSSGNKPPFKEMGSSPVKFDPAFAANTALAGSNLKDLMDKLKNNPKSLKDTMAQIRADHAEGGKFEGGIGSGLMSWLTGQGKGGGENIDSANVPVHGDDRHTGKTLASIPGVHTPLKLAGPTGSMDAETNLGRSVQFQ